MVFFSSFPAGSDNKESACNAGDLGSIPGLGRSPGGGHGSSLQYSCLENPHGQRSLAGYSPWGCKESDMTERLSPVQHNKFFSSITECHNGYCHSKSILKVFFWKHVQLYLAQCFPNLFACQSCVGMMCAFVCVHTYLCVCLCVFVWLNICLMELVFMKCIDTLLGYAASQQISEMRVRGNSWIADCWDNSKCKVYQLQSNISILADGAKELGT